MTRREHSYRTLIRRHGGDCFRIGVKETDLLVHAPADLEPLARELVFKYRAQIESYIQAHPDFMETLAPWTAPGPAPGIVRDMIDAGQKAGVGPMAAVAGAVAGRVGTDLLARTDAVMVENGGDIFLKTVRPVTMGVYAGRSPLSMRIGLRIDTSDAPLAVCTSSGTVGHSTSFGKADAVCAVSASCPLADAAATAVCNMVQRPDDIQNAAEFAKSIEGIDGVVIVMGKYMGMFGKLDVVPLNG